MKTEKACNKMQLVPKYLFLVLGILLAFPGFSQTKETWQQVAQRSTNFYEIKAAFMQENALKLTAYQKDMDDLNAGVINQIPKGKYPGIKQFLRMAEWYEPRVKESNGDLLTVGRKDMEARLSSLNSPEAINAANWSIIGPSSIPASTGNGRVNNIRIDPNNANILYACTPASQLFKSTDAGVSWTSISNGIPATGVTDLAINPTNSNILYALTGDGDQALYHPFSAGLYKSLDGGTTWNTTGLSFVQGNYTGLTSIIIHPTSTNTILISATDGIRRSTDGGATFTKTSTQATQNLVFKPGDPNIVFAGSKYGGIFLRSIDNGVSWTQITSGMPISGAVRFAIDVSPANPNYVYAMASNTSNGMQGFYSSIDGGLTFKLMATTPNIGGGQAWYDFAVAADPLSDKTVYACGVDVFKSVDTGKTWVNITNVYGGGTTHPDMHDLTFAGSSTLYLANDGGIYKTTNAGVSWTNLSSNLTISQPYAIGLSATDPNTIIMGTQDNGTILTNNLTSWRLTRGGDGMIGFIDRTNNNNMYSSYQNGGLGRSINGGNSWTSALTGITGSGYWVTPYMQDPLAPATIYCGTDKVFRSTNGAANWSAISPSFGTVRWLDVDRNNTQIIYAMTNATVQKTSNGGSNWATAASGIPGGVELLHIHIDVNNSNILYLSISSYNGNNLYRSTDAGVSWSNWGTGLPGVPANTVLTVKGSSGEVYCGTDIGVYYRNTAAGSWTAFNTNLPPVPVRDLEIFYPSGALRAGTFGRGIWETQLNVPICGFASGIVYVNKLAAGTNSGKDWANAFTELTTAINAITTTASVCNITQIRVAAGTYKPTTGTDRNATFSMLNNIAIYGGFAGNEPSNYDINLRNFSTNTTTISGDIGTGATTDNCYNVIRNQGNNLNSTAILDGFTISGGNANGGNIVPTSNLNCGGGMYNSQSSPSITNCIFTNNTAMGSANTGGGGMFNYNSASPTISKCSFIGNTSNSGGGGLFNNFTSSPAISNCTFTGNSSTGLGGGIHNYSSSNPNITNCRFINNNAAGGGGLYNNYGAPVLVNCLFTGNNGGANGGAIFQDNASLTITNSSFSGNTATSGGGLKTSASLTLTVATSNVTNSIFWGNGSTEIVTTNSSFGNAVTNVTYSIVQGGISGTGNLNANPQFAFPGDFHLKEQSPAIDGGIATGAPLQDIEAIVRIASPDMGAFENPQSCLGSNKLYYSDVAGTAYQWQVNTGSGYVDIANGASYSNVSTNKLTVINPANITTGYKFRCRVTTGGGNVFSSEITMRFYNRWLGTADTNWQNTANWSCGSLPTQYTDVIVPSAKTIYPLTSVSGTIRKLQTENGSSVRLTTGSSLVIVGKD